MKKKKYSKVAAGLASKNEAGSLHLRSNFLKNKAFWGLLIIILMFGSVISFSFFYRDTDEQGGNKAEYRGYIFVNNGEGWVTEFNGQQVAFEYNPREVEDINMEKFGFGFTEGNIAFDPGEFKSNSYEIGRLRALLSLKGISVFPACIKEEGCEDIPIVKCEERIIFLKLGNETKGYWDTCFVLEAKSSDILKAIDRFIYDVYGIMD